MRLPLPLLLIAFAACAGESTGPSDSAVMSAAIDGASWRAGGEGHMAPTATYYTGDRTLFILGIGDRAGGDGFTQLSITIGTNDADNTYGLADTTSASHARVIMSFGNIITDSTRIDVFLTNQNASGLATIASLDLDRGRTTGSFFFDPEGGPLNRTMTVTAGSWDLPVQIIEGLHQ